MAQLPPKIPSNIMTHPNWPPSFPPHHRMPPLTTVPPSQQPPSWMDDFLDYSSVKRGSHRRSMSDSIAFLDGGGAGGGNGGGCSGGGFDRLDDEQLMSMFSDEFSAGINGMVGPPSSPSDQNSDNDEDPMSTGNCNGDNGQQPPKSEPGEVESACNTHNLLSAAAPPSDKNANQTSDGEPIFDTKRVKRILANRQSAQRSRVRKLQYISELERSVTSLQTEVSALSPRVAFLDHQRLILNVDNSSLKQRLAALAQDKIFKDAHQEALKREIERLRQIYQHQQNKMGNNAADHHTMGCTDKEQLMT